MKRFHHFESLETAMSTKFSCNADNNKYIVGGGLVGNTTISDVPEVDWQCIVYVKNARMMWTHGRWYCGGMIYVTYEQLGRMIDFSSLIPGASYSITDYTFVVDERAQNDFISGNHMFNIVVKAINSNTLSEEASADWDNNDTYFDDCLIRKWKLWYCFENDTNRFEWACDKNFLHCIKPDSNVSASGTYKFNEAVKGVRLGADYEFCELSIGVRTLIERGPRVYVTLVDSTTLLVEDGADTTGICVAYYGLDVFGHGGKGVIYRMIDEFGNDCPYDFKNVRFKKVISNTTMYLYTFCYFKRDVQNSEVDFSFYGNYGFRCDDIELSGQVYNNVIKERFDKDSKKFKLPGVLFIGDDLLMAGDGNIYNNYIGCNCTNIEIEHGVNDCYIGDNCYTIGLNRGVSRITIGDYSKEIHCAEGVRDTRIGNYCYGISIDPYSTNNIFDDYCGYEHIDNMECGSVILSRYCSRNHISSYCYDIRLADDCCDNEIGQNSYNITFDMTSQFNAIEGNNWIISVGSGSSFNRIGKGCRTIDLGNNCSNNVYGPNCYSITLGSNCSNNVYGPDCHYVYMKAAASTSSAHLSYCWYNVFDPGVSYVYLLNTNNPSSTNKLQNVHVHRLNNSSGYLSVTIPTLNNPNIYHVGSMQMSSNFYALGLYETSDESLKDFSDKVVVDFDKLAKLKKNYFTWKDSDDKSRQIGVSAQEIQEIYPEIVSDNNGTLTVAYDKLSVIALAAVDMLSERLSSIENRLNAIDGLSK